MKPPRSCLGPAAKPSRSSRRFTSGPPRSRRGVTAEPPRSLFDTFYNLFLPFLLHFLSVSSSFNFRRLERLIPIRRFQSAPPPYRVYEDFYKNLISNIFFTLKCMCTHLICQLRSTKKHFHEQV